ncbi:MAG: imidazole glycerol phosphate synthase subunit HisH, partial [Ilumatobacteraceae bacterium]
MSARTRVAVLDYGIGNLRSAQKALERVGADAVLTSESSVAENADAVVLPGVGAFGSCMDALRSAGLESVVHGAVNSGVPFLGICVGMQMLFDSSDEDPAATGLGIIPGVVSWIPDSVPRPQMQLNQLQLRGSDSLFNGLGADPWMYFVHSLHGVPNDEQHVIATVTYGDVLNVAFRKNNVCATQFHPEKSASAGLALL